MKAQIAEVMPPAGGKVLRRYRKVILMAFALRCSN